MNTPLVSVVCLCYNHERFVEEALQSVRNQTYPNIQLIVVDDYSTDESVEVIKRVLSDFPGAEFMACLSNLGNCIAFNKGFEKTKGDFIIDLSADDVLLPERIEKGVKIFQSVGVEVGVNFGDAEQIDETGKSLGFHSDRFPHDTIPRGDVYREVISGYFINSPTMMVRRTVFEKLGGYDESLAYEDFDFWVRSARYFKYCYTAEPLVKRRIVASSLGQKQYNKGSKQLGSTFKVCEKAYALNKTSEENDALKKRIRYEIRHALRLGEIRLAWEYWKLARKTDEGTFPLSSQERG